MILITGGAGFIGSNLVNFLLKKTDWDIKVLDDLSNGDPRRLKKIKGFNNRVELIEGDIRDKGKVKEGVRNCDYVVNLAAQVGVIPSIQNPYKDAEINIFGLINLLNACKESGVNKFVHASSCAPLGNSEVPIQEERIPKPLSPYGASKLAGEGYCSAFSNSYGINTIALRFSNVYGPRSKHKKSVIHIFISRILENSEISIYGDGEQTRDYIHVKDICKGIYLSLKKNLKNHELIQLGTGTETTVNELYNELKELFEEKGYEVPEPNHKEPRSGEIQRNYTDITKAKELLNYEPSTELRKGLEKTIQWYIENT